MSNTGEPGTPATGGNGATQNEPPKTFTQEEVNALLAKEKREAQVKYERFDEYKAAFEENQRLAEAAKDELTKAKERAEAATKELKELKAASEQRAWVASVSKETGVPEAALHGSTEEEVRSCAESLLEYFKKDSAPTVGTGAPSEGGSVEGDLFRALFN